MKILRSTYEALTEVNNRINSGLAETVSGYHAQQYSSIMQDAEGYFLLIDENDSRNPLQFLTKTELSLTQDYTPPIEEGEQI
ncbi:MAG: hypothetical protein HUU43_10340 [Ignavibacteriaceae bacterium]|nr:hypothetical protein [Ignavibacteriaceae bacterium]